MNHALVVQAKNTNNAMAKSNSIVHAVVGILWRDHQLLVCERPQGKPYAGFWEFPGGKIEKSESSFDALKRELQEELGIEVQTAEFIIQHQHQYPDKQVILDIWKVTKFIGEPDSLEQQQLKWTTAEELRKLNLLEGNWAILSAIQEIKPQNLQIIRV